MPNYTIRRRHKTDSVLPSINEETVELVEKCYAEPDLVKCINKPYDMNTLTMIAFGYIQFPNTNKDEEHCTKIHLLCCDIAGHLIKKSLSSAMSISDELIEHVFNDPHNPCYAEALMTDHTFMKTSMHHSVVSWYAEHLDTLKPKLDSFLDWD